MRVQRVSVRCSLKTPGPIHHNVWCLAMVLAKGEEGLARTLSSCGRCSWVGVGGRVDRFIEDPI